MVETALGKRARKTVVLPQRDDRRLAQAAARSIVAGKLTGATFAARAYGLPNPSNVSYWHGVLRGLDPECYKAAFESESTTRATGNTSTTATTSSTCSMDQPTPPTKTAHLTRRSQRRCRATSRMLASRLSRPTSLNRQCSYKKKQEAMSIRDATAAIHRNYEHLPEVPQICASTVHSCLANPGKVWQPQGGMSYLPDKSYIELVRWIKLRRSLKLPVFKDDVLSTANAMAKDCKLVEEYKEGYLTNAWYYNFLKRFSHELGKAKIKTLEIDRERWATADNLREWYDMLADALIAAKVTVKNPDYDPSLLPPDINAQPRLHCAA
eukprot:6185519-Pleurochrysis_carterae.AAC.1